MAIVVLLAAFLLLGVAVFVLERRRAAPATPARRDRVLAAAALGAILLVTLSPSWLAVDSRDLPVERPAEPWRTPGEGCGDGGDHTGLLIVLLAGYLAVRAGPAAGLAIHAARSAPPRRMPDGRAAARVATWAFAITAALATARVAACGAPGDRFTTYGAITPAGASGWRTDLALAIALDDAAPIPTGPPIADELEHHAGSHMLGSGPYTTAARGLQAWVDGAPVLFRIDGARVVGSPVLHRDPAMIPPARRPHFAAWPRVARLDRRALAIVGPAAGGGTLAVKVSDHDLSAEPASYADAGLLARPRLWPWLLGLALGAAGLALARRDRAPSRLAGAWLLLEATAVLAYAHVGALGLLADL